MPESHFFDANTMEWSEHPQFPNIRFKALETHETHPSARFSLVQVTVGELIDTHVHEEETEIAYVLAGRGTLTLGDNQTLLGTGMGVTIPPGLPHSLRNTGDLPMELIATHIASMR